MTDLANAPFPLIHGDVLQVRKIRDNGMAVAELRLLFADPVHVLMVPVTVEELSPPLANAQDAAIPGSQFARPLPESNAMVERDPTPEAPRQGQPDHRITDASERRIAWRDIEVKVGKAFADRTVTWRMTALFTPHVVTREGTANLSEQTGPDPHGGPRFRGSWEHAAQVAHRDAFSHSEAYTSTNTSWNRRWDSPWDWKRGVPTTGSTPGTATTKVDDDGYTAIRVNLPPIGFNKARVSIEIEGVDTRLDLLDLEVPAVVVIDPGHGGTANAGVSSWNNAFSYGSAVAPSDTKKPRRGNETMADYRARLDPKRSTETVEQYWQRLSVTLEKDMTLQYGLGLRHSLRELANNELLTMCVIMTRTGNTNKTINARTDLAKQHGADNFFSIYFNSDPHDWLRGPEVLVRHQNDGNVNLAQDRLFANKIQTIVDAIPGAPAPGDVQVINTNTNGYRGIKEYSPPKSGVDNNTRLGNQATGPASHACLVEIEFITSSNVQGILASGATSDAQCQTIVNGFADAIRIDILTRANER